MSQARRYVINWFNLAKADFDDFVFGFLSLLQKLGEWLARDEYDDTQSHRLIPEFQ